MRQNIPPQVSITIRAFDGVRTAIVRDVLDCVWGLVPSDTYIRKTRISGQAERFGSATRYQQLTEYMDYREREMRGILRKMLPLFIRDGRKFKIVAHRDYPSHIAIFIEKD